MLNLTVFQMHLFSFTGPLAESLTMILIITYLAILSAAPGSACYNRVYDFSWFFMFSAFMSLFTLSNQLTNFIKSGPIGIIQDEKYGGHLIVLLSNMAAIIFKILFVYFMNMIINDSIFTKQIFGQRSLTTEFDILNTTSRFAIILLICVLPSAMFVSSSSLRSCIMNNRIK